MGDEVSYKDGYLYWSEHDDNGELQHYRMKVDPPNYNLGEFITSYAPSNHDLKLFDVVKDGEQYKWKRKGE